MLWQLFVATANHLSRSLDRDRLHASDEKLAAGADSIRKPVARQKTEIERFSPRAFPRPLPGRTFCHRDWTTLRVIPKAGQARHCRQN